MSKVNSDAAHIPRWVTTLIATAGAMAVVAIACVMLLGGRQCGFDYGITAIFAVLPAFVVLLIGVIPFASILNAWLIKKIGCKRTIVAWVGLVMCAAAALIIYAHMPFPNAPAVLTGVQGQPCSLPDF